MSSNSEPESSHSSESEYETNFNRERGLRRSLRTSKPISRFNLFAITCILLIILINNVNTRIN